MRKILIVLLLVGGCASTTIKTSFYKGELDYPIKTIAIANSIFVVVLKNIITI